MFTDLTFKSLRVTPVSVPLSNPVRTASGTITEAPLALIDLVSEEGVEGRTYLFTYTPLVLKPICQLLEGLASLLRGTSLAPLNVERTLGARFRFSGPPASWAWPWRESTWPSGTRSARAADLPLVRLLGGTTKPVRAYFSQGMDGKELGMKLADEAILRGFTAMKIKIGYPTVEEDVDVIKGVQSVLGKQARLIVDYNQFLSVPEAVRRCRVLDELGLLWIEEPVSQDDYLGHARVASLPRPLSSGARTGSAWRRWAHRSRPGGPIWRWSTS